MQIERLEISLGAQASPQVDAGIDRFWIFRCHSPEGKFHYAGRVSPTPSSRNRSFVRSCLRRKSAYRFDARCHPSSSTKVLSVRRFMLMGLSHFGQCGTSSEGTVIFGTVPSGRRRFPSLPITNPWASTICRWCLHCHRLPCDRAGCTETGRNRPGCRTGGVCQIRISGNSGRRLWSGRNNPFRRSGHRERYIQVLADSYTD